MDHSQHSFIGYSVVIILDGLKCASEADLQSQTSSSGGQGLLIYEPNYCFYCKRCLARMDDQRDQRAGLLNLFNAVQV